MTPAPPTAREGARALRPRGACGRRSPRPRPGIDVRTHAGAVAARDTVSGATTRRADDRRDAQAATQVATSAGSSDPLPSTTTRELTQSCHVPVRRPHLPWPMASPVRSSPCDAWCIAPPGDGNGAPPAAGEGPCAGSPSLRERLDPPPPASLSRSLRSLADKPASTPARAIRCMTFRYGRRIAGCVLSGTPSLGRVGWSARCGELIHAREPWDLGHVDDAGPRAYSAPEHARCNRATNPGRSTSRIW